MGKRSGQVGDNGTERDSAAGSEAGPAAEAYSQSPGLVGRLRSLNAAVAFSSYQSGVLYMLGVNPRGGAQIHQSALPKPMGLAYRDGRLVVSSAYQIFEYANVLEPGERANQVFDACFMPRRVHVTGQLDAHDVSLDSNGVPIFVNTRFNCVARVDARHSFHPVWRPPFISRLVNEDRCHLNGFAVVDGEVRYATAVSRSDTIDGWRDRRSDGGIVIDVRTGRIVCEALSMPHSPRLFAGELWLLNSGTGELGVVTGLDGTDRMGRFEPRAFCPGFVRGLTLHDGFAFIGLSKPRYERFEGLALDQRLKDSDSEPWCGLQVIDLKSGSCVDWFRIDGRVQELYDVCVLPGIGCAMTISPRASEQATLVTFRADSELDGGGPNPV